MRTITDVMEDIEALFRQLDLLEAELREINFVTWQKKHNEVQNEKRRQKTRSIEVGGEADWEELR